MNKTLTMIVRIEAKPEKIELVKSELVKLVNPTRQEEGCMQYFLLQDNKNPAVFVFHEKWANSEAFQKHLTSPSIAEFQKAIKDAVMSFTVNEMTECVIA